MRSAVLLVLLLLAQDPPKRTRDEIIKDLEAKFLASGPISAELELSVRAPSKETRIKGRGTLYLDAKDRRTYLMHRKFEEGKEGAPQYFYCEGNSVKIWGDPEKPVHLDTEHNGLQWIPKLVDIAGALDKILAKSGAEGSASYLKGHVAVRLAIEADGEETALRFALGKTGRKPSISWFEELKQEPAGPFREAEDEVEFDLPGRVIAVDRSTGLLRRYQLNLKDGECRILKLTSIRTPADPPQPAFPARFSTPLITNAEWMRFLKTMILGISAWSIDSILEELDEKALADKAGGLRELFAGILEFNARSIWQAAVSTTADDLVAKYESKGGDLEELSRRLDTVSLKLEEIAKEVEADCEKAIRENVRETQEILARLVQKRESGTPKSRSALEEIVRTAVKDPGEARFKPVLPDAKEVLRQAIQRAKDAK